jgi:hypothetical protein
MNIGSTFDGITIKNKLSKIKTSSANVGNNIKICLVTLRNTDFSHWPLARGCSDI